MTHLLWGAVQFLIAVFGRWQTWLSGGGVGGFLVVATSLIEKLTGHTLSRKMHLAIFVIAFFLCSCLIAWIDEHDKADGLASALDATRAQVSRSESTFRAAIESQSNDCRNQANSLRQEVAVKEAISQTLQTQNRDQQALIAGCQSEAIRRLVPPKFDITVLKYDSTTGGTPPGTTTRYILLANTTRPHVRIQVLCQGPVLGFRVEIPRIPGFQSPANTTTNTYGFIGHTQIDTDNWGPDSPLPINISAQNGQPTCTFSNN